MRILITFTLWLLIAASSLYGQEQRYTLAFYNIENLFDTIDQRHNDNDFLPTGKKEWNTTKYRSKLRNMAEVIGKIAALPGFTAIGLAEVENRTVLIDLLNTPPLKGSGLGIIHYDSRDKRGIDVALLYNPTRFSPIRSNHFAVTIPGRPHFSTRDLLLVEGYINSELMHLIVCHWPSQLGGESKSRPNRLQAARRTRQIADSVLTRHPGSKLVIMGDLNDNPDGESVARVLEAKHHAKEVKARGYFNALWHRFDQGIGTLVYENKWNLFDQFILSHSLLKASKKQLHYQGSEVFSPPLLCTKQGRPLRTLSRKGRVIGYSDHFPILLYLSKK